MSHTRDSGFRSRSQATQLSVLDADRLATQAKLGVSLDFLV
ncbi:MAG: hypothetical protein WCA35_11265 [Kovacikia sp.]